MLVHAHNLPRLLWVALISACCAHVVACGEGATTTKQKQLTSNATSSSSNGLELLDPADDVMAGVGESPTQTNTLANPTNKAATRAPQSKGAATSSNATSNANSKNVSSKGRWSVMLQTFSQPDHVDRAAAFRAQLVREYPELAGATSRRVGKGSAIVLGRFESPDDMAAQAELKRVKAIQRQGQRPFGGSMLIRTATDDASIVIKPFDLRNLRAKYPKVRPLFSLQVAAWSTFNEKGVDYAPMRVNAERYCAELRAKGHDAWFHHDEDSETSVVTVGMFDRRAYDAQSTLFSAEVEDLMRQFPANLLNGEPLLVPVDASSPSGKTKAQPCRLVEVPET